MIKRLLSILILMILMPLCLTVIYADSNNQHDNAKQEKESSGNSEEIPFVSISADKTKANVGDLIKLKIEYKLPPGSTYNGFQSNGFQSNGSQSNESDNNEFKFEGLNGLTVISREAEKDEIRLTILVDKTQAFKIGPVSLTFKDKNNELNIIKSEELDIDVLSNLGDKPAEARLKPIMDIIPTYPLWLRILPYALGILGVLIIIGGILYWNKRKSVQKQILSQLKPPHVIAKEELKRLMLMKLIEKGKYKEFYFRFSEILRIYIERLRGFPAAEMTSEEIIRRIKDEKDRKLVPVLRESDLVKFADKKPTKANIEEDIKIALRYIKETTPEPTVAEHGS